jgi:hypothetical protein
MRAEALRDMNSDLRGRRGLDRHLGAGTEARGLEGYPVHIRMQTPVRFAH